MVPGMHVGILESEERGVRVALSLFQPEDSSRGDINAVCMPPVVAARMARLLGAAAAEALAIEEEAERVIDLGEVDDEGTLVAALRERREEAERPAARPRTLGIAAG